VHTEKRTIEQRALCDGTKYGKLVSEVICLTSEVFLEVMTTGLLTLLKVVAPVLLISLIVGLVISFFQAVTQIHEQTLTFAPKILIVFLTLVFLGGWILQQIVEYAYEILTRYMALI